MKKTDVLQPWRDLNFVGPSPISKDQVGAGRARRAKKVSQPVRARCVIIVDEGDVVSSNRVERGVDGAITGKRNAALRLFRDMERERQPALPLVIDPL
jgi:hypothetical protein